MLNWPASVLAKTLRGLSRKLLFTVPNGCACFCDTMCLDILRQRKKVLLLLLLMASGSIFYYLYTLKLERERDANVSSTTSRLEREISDLQAVFESEVVPQLGALGRPARGNWTTEELEAIAKSQRETGYNAWLSKRISPERTLYDMRHRSCKKLKYPLEKLPSVSVVITYHNEEASVLLRTLSSLRSRTPVLLLREIILVDDGSSSVDEKLNDFLQIKFLNMVKHHRISTQVGLIQARVTGANLALADVLVFLDSHVEVTHGWLEPLLAPILTSNRTCTTPIIDTIDYETFAYRRGKPSRGFFNWQLNYIQLPLLKEEAVAMPAPHKNPIMNGGLFAIGRQWFAELGGYDKGLKIWGGEQLELSLKLWLCGGQILEVPCSRIGHLYRDGNFQIRYTDKDKNSEKKLIQRNYRRVAEVWLDELKDKVFANMPHLTVIPAGNLAEQRDLRKRLHCKPFKWFLDHLAADFLNLYPIIDPAEYATGVLQSVSSPKLCLDRTESRPGRPKLSSCSGDRVFPRSELHWTLTNHRELQSGLLCLEVRNQGMEVYIYHCHRQKGNQFWSFDPKTRQVISGQMQDSRLCLEVQPEIHAVTTGDCDPKNSKQQWKFGYQNNERLHHFWDNVKTH
ncbi:LOW QUALITY PROTEIN: polypeptide N-acetylgalactosaminyltransferase 8 [Drosophila rhopaloa]|uniref:Polypeptide N-acetylgalactosaminyltransferase n=1 Tax=Drosophila rhopaloa TaxID=1041015 RepID=A0ABM5HHG1_DRORH|nr:LOW QUALITY PROTEIN: polypeptide N-acetylgalactosaminyltransferase 8 [Drosophila rhopaloa]